MAAQLASPYSYFTDANGVPLASGLIYTYAAGTTTPQNSYTDSTGGTPAANPVVLDSAGKAAMWLSGSYKIVVKDSLGNTISTTDNITTASSAITSAVDSAFTINNASDATKKIAFSASGITTGTTRTITVPDKSGTLAMLSDVATGGMTLLSTVNAVAAASVTFNSTYITNAYNKYVIEFDGLVNSVSSADLYVTYSTNNGSVYLSSGYFSWGQYQPYNSATITGAAATTASQISLGLGNGFGLAAATPSSGTLKFSNPSASAILAMQFELFASQSGSPTYNRISGWAYNAGTTAINNIKIAPSSGTTTGNFHLYGIAGT